MQQRKAEIIAEAKRKGKSIFEVATKNINDDFFMIEPNEENIAEINKRYEGTTREIQEKFAEEFNKGRRTRNRKELKNELYFFNLSNWCALNRP